MVEERLRQEHELLLKFYAGTLRNGLWFLIPSYPIAAGTGWNRASTPIAFQAQGNHPAAPPYGFHVSAGILCNNAKPGSYTEPSSTKPPFDGDWGMFSWQIGDGVPWIPRADLVSGSNLLNFVRSIADRFSEGA